jgi:hypothetical protein
MTKTFRDNVTVGPYDNPNDIVDRPPILMEAKAVNRPTPPVLKYTTTRKCISPRPIVVF